MVQVSHGRYHPHTDGTQDASSYQGCLEIQKTKTLQESSYALMRQTITRLGYSGWKITDESIESACGSRIIFRGLKDIRAAGQVKGPEAFDIFWLEEAATISHDSLRMLCQPLRKPGSELWASWNPETDNDPIDERLWNSTRDAFRIWLNPGVEDNPYWGPELQKEMEEDYKRDPDEAEHTWGGQPRKQGQRAVMSRACNPSSHGQGSSTPRVLSKWVVTSQDLETIGTELYKRKGLVTIDHREFVKQDTMKTAYECWDMAGRRSKRSRLFIDDTGVGCLAKGTRVLTPNGWKLVEDMAINDSVYSKNDKGDITIEKVRLNTKREPTRIIKSGEFEFSFSHIIPYHTRLKNKLLLGSWENILDRKYVIFDSDFEYGNKSNDFVVDEYSIEMPHGGTKNIQKESTIPAKAFASFLGWFLSEGYLDRSTNGIGISQKKSYNFGSIIDACSYLGKPQIKKGGMVVYNKSIFDWVEKNCYEGGYGFRYLTVPRWLANNSTDVIETFLDSFIAGDGYMKNDVRYYSTSSKWLVQDIIELINKIGKKGNAYIHEKAGSTSFINGRTLTRTVDNYCVFEYQQKKKKYNTCLTTNEKNRDMITYTSFVLQVKQSCTIRCVRIHSNLSGLITAEFQIGSGSLVQSYCVKLSGPSPSDRQVTSIADELWFNFPIAEVDIPDDNELMQQLSSRQYTYDNKGRRKIESKQTYKDRCGHSPDDADSLLLCFFSGTGTSFPDDIRDAMRQEELSSGNRI